MNKIKNHNLIRRYIGALALIAFLSISSFIITQNLITIQEKNVAVINVSVRQRMLSQRAVAITLQLVSSESSSEKEQLKQKLMQTATLIEESHFSLINGNASLNLPGTSSDEIEKMYFATPLMVDQKVKTFIENLRNFAQSPGLNYSKTNQAYLYIINEGQTSVLNSLNAVISQHQQEAETATLRLVKIETGIMFFALLILLFEGLLILRPMAARILKDKESLTQANEQLEKLSSFDGLTGIPNRRCFDDFLNREWQRSLRNKTVIVVIMADIDYFKVYNDTYGHLAGDQCLKTVAGVLKGCLNRPTDMVARYGGEEFVAVLGDSDLKGALLLAEQMRAGVETLKMENKNSKVKNTVTISLGVAAVSPTREMTSQMLVEAADQALYQAKQEGRNRVCKNEKSGLFIK